MKLAPGGRVRLAVAILVLLGAGSLSLYHATRPAVPGTEQAETVPAAELTPPECDVDDWQGANLPTNLHGRRSFADEELPNLHLQTMLEDGYGPQDHRQEMLEDEPGPQDHRQEMLSGGPES